MLIVDAQSISGHKARHPGCVTIFTEELPRLKGPDLEFVKGRAA